MEFTDTTSDPATIVTRATAALQANPDVDAVLSVGPHVCEGVAKAILAIPTNKNDFLQSQVYPWFIYR